MKFRMIHDHFLRIQFTKLIDCLKLKLGEGLTVIVIISRQVEADQ